jgi:hypothetical protein
MRRTEGEGGDWDSKGEVFQRHKFLVFISISSIKAIKRDKWIRKRKRNLEKRSRDILGKFMRFTQVGTSVKAVFTIA